ncbi:MAG: formyltransferase family protein [Pseudomonadota bacterium]
MRVMIIGQKWLAEQLLALCLQRGDDVAAVCAPRVDDRLAAAATEAHVPVCTVAGPIEGDWIPDGVDVLLCANLHAFLTASARGKTRLGALGYHPSLLPRHRGRDAIRWAIHMRELLTGGTVYWMDDGADTGPIAAQSWCWIRPDDTPEALWRRELAPMGLTLFAQVLAGIDAGQVTKRPQDDRLATWEPAWRVKKLAGS